MIATKVQDQVSNFSQKALQAAHDIQSPILALQAVLSTMENLDDRRKNLAIAALCRIREITDGLRDNHHQKMPHQEPDQNLRNLIEQIVLEKKFLLPKEISLETKLDGDLKISEERAKELKRIISNLLNNSVEAIYKKTDRGIIQITLRRLDDDIVICVNDNGCGIPENILNKVGQLGFSYNKKDGHGLGLSRAKEILRKWKGQILVESAIGQYTRVTLVF